MATKKRFANGPWRGVRQTSEPGDESRDLANDCRNLYLPDPANRSAFYSRPGFFLPATVGGTYAQAVFSGVTSGGAFVSYVVSGGQVYQFNPASLDGALTNVTPTTVRISAVGPTRGYGVIANGVLIFNDGVNPPWTASNLGAGVALVATCIDLQAPATVLSRSVTNDRQFALAASEFILNGTFQNIAAVAGTAFPAGTIPASQYGAYRVIVANGGAVTVQAATANYTTGYASAAAALAGLPSYTLSTHWSLGTIVVQASGATWVAGTDALTGGTSGNPATATTYASGEPRPWRAYGKPVIYVGAAVFIEQQRVTGVAPQNTIVWSEPNQFDVGFQQANYDNAWTLTQTGGDPIYTLVATNQALLYSRAYSWGALRGAPNVNFQNTATHDLLSANVGCRSPASTLMFLDALYFLDAEGRPWRWRVGDAPEPIWLQMREYVEDNATALRATLDATPEFPYVVLDPNLNVVLVIINGTANFAFDAGTGRWMGRWDGPTAFYAGGTVRDTAGGAWLVMLGIDLGVVARFRLSRPADARWTDNGTSLAVQVLTDWFAHSDFDALRATRLMATAESGDNGTPVAITAELIGTERTAAGITASPVATTSDARLPRYQWSFGSEIGRGYRARLSANVSSQLKLSRITLEVEVSEARASDR